MMPARAGLPLATTRRCIGLRELLTPCHRQTGMKRLGSGPAIGALALALAGAGCGGDTDSVDAVSTSDQAQSASESCGEGASDADYALNALRTRAGSASGGWAGESLSDFLPNALHEFEGEPRPIFDRVVVGEIVEASNGVGFSLPGSPEQESGPNDGQTQVPFDSAEADWQTVHAEIAVEMDLGDPGGSPRNSVVAGFVIDPCLDETRFRNGLTSLGPAVYFLSSESAVFDYDDGVSGVGGDGTLVATIGGTEALALPMLSEQIEERFLASTPTMDALMVGANAEDHIVTGT